MRSAGGGRPTVGLCGTFLSEAEKPGEKRLTDGPEPQPQPETDARRPQPGESRDFQRAATYGKGCSLSVVCSAFAF